VSGTHVLGEILRLHKLADVVKIRANAAQGRVGVDSLGGGLGEVGHGKAMVIGSGRFQAQALEQRVIEIRHFQPGNVRRDAKKILQDGKNSAGQDRRAEAGNDCCQALPPHHLPIRLRRILPDERSNLAEGSRQHPHRDAHVYPGPDKPAAAANLDCNVYRDEARDEGDNQEYRINAANQQRTPQAGEHGREKTVVLPEQHGKDERGEGVGHQQWHQLKVDIPGRGSRKNNFDDSQLDEQNAENQGDAGIAAERLRVIDPKLSDSGDENEETKKKLLCRLLLLTGKNQGRQTADESAENQESDGPRALECFGKLGIAHCAARLAASHSFSYEAAALEKIPHSCKQGNLKLESFLLQSAMLAVGLNN
jgi:hypothetical protein